MLPGEAESWGEMALATVIVFVAIVVVAFGALVWILSRLLIKLIGAEQSDERRSEAK